MCTAAQEMKRLGLAYKPMIIGLKSNVHEIAEAYRTLKYCFRAKKILHRKNACEFSGILITMTGTV